MEMVNCERCGDEIPAFYGPGTYHCGFCADPGKPLAWNSSVPKHEDCPACEQSPLGSRPRCPECECFECECDDENV